MFFKLIDRFFDEIKQFISLIIFIMIALSLLMIAFWITCIIKITLPGWLNDFCWGIVNCFAPLYKAIPSYQGVTDVMPVFTALILAVLIYALNCLIMFIEDLHNKAHTAKEYCKVQLEKTINEQLKQSFVEELNKNTLMLIKIKINVEKETSKFNYEEVQDINADALSKEISYRILSSVNSELIQTKGKIGDSIYFMLSDFDKSKNFFMDLVSKSSKIIGTYVKPHIKLSFCCAADMYENISDFEKVNHYLDQILNLNNTNKIVATSAVKVYYETIHPDIYYFKLLGEYNIKDFGGITRTVSLYTMQRR